ncbi:DNA repair exonuclease [Lentibacillus sp. N15]|uniref:metallophosphoesterase family protein n=1 Tax=Lentibacillus songyuanensis TaxID=3136161 RepID=UPI0031BBC46E
MPKQLSFLHAADLHLDSPFKGMARVPEAIFKEIQESTFVALNRLAETAIEKQVDFILLVGDLFDNEQQSLKAQVRLRDVFEKLRRHRIQVYMSYGNHDYINGNRYPIVYPDNVFVFPDETVRSFVYKKDGQQLAAISGFSYQNRAVLTNKAMEFAIDNERIPFHIAMLHGSVHSNTDHDKYAPFYLSELQEQHVDYWALGHIHKRAVLFEHPPIIYPGNIQGRHRKESGEKGCYYVEMNEKETKTSFIPLQAIRFEAIAIDIAACHQIHQLESVIQNTFTAKLDPGPQLISLLLTGSSGEHRQWETEGMITDIIELMNESFIERVNWLYIYQHRLDKAVNHTEEMLKQGEHFFGELIRQADQASIQPFVKELYQHREARKHLKRLSATEEEMIKQKAKEYLLQELLHHGGESV